MNFNQNPKDQRDDIIEEQKCLIEAAIKSEIDAGVPESRRTRAWYISCPCKKCSPSYF